MVITIDLETTIFNKGNPFDSRNFCVSIHIKKASSETFCKFYDDPDFLTETRSALAGASLLCGVNIKFDIHHLRKLGVVLPATTRVWDCMLAEFILSGQTNPFASLDELAARYGLGKKYNEVAEYWEKGISTEHIPRELVSVYGNHDVDLTHSVYQAQLEDSRMTPALHKLILLDGLDLLVLADMEWNGFKYDAAGSLARAEELTEELEKVDEEIFSHSPCKFNLDSGDWLSAFLYGGTMEQPIYAATNLVYKSGPKKGLSYTQNQYQRTDTYVFPNRFTPLKGTELKKDGFYSTAEDTLLQLKAKAKESKRIIQLLLRRAVISKLCGTYLLAMPALIETMFWEQNIIHGQFNQVVARTGRLSSSRPNMQNAPEDVDEFFITRF